MNNEFKFEFLLLRRQCRSWPPRVVCMKTIDTALSSNKVKQYAFQSKEHRCLISLPDKMLDCNSQDDLIMCFCKMNSAIILCKWLHFMDLSSEEQSEMKEHVKCLRIPPEIQFRFSSNIHSHWSFQAIGCGWRYSEWWDAWGWQASGLAWFLKSDLHTIRLVFYTKTFR